MNKYSRVWPRENYCSQSKRLMEGYDATTCVSRLHFFFTDFCPFYISFMALVAHPSRRWSSCNWVSFDLNSNPIGQNWKQTNKNGHIEWPILTMNQTFKMTKAMLHTNIQSSIGAFIQCSGVRSSLSYLIPVLDKLSIVFGIIFNILLLLEKPGLWTHASGSDQSNNRKLYWWKLIQKLIF